MKKILNCLFLSIALFPAFADSFKRFTLELENDLFAGEDNGYTHGTKINFASYGVRDNGEFSVTQHSFFQFIYTPTYIDIAEPQINDRPWAGSAAYEFSKYNQYQRFFNFYGFQIGVIGPSSLSEHSQKEVHKLVDAREPLGWDNQLSDRPLIGNFGGIGMFYYKGNFVQVSQHGAFYIGSHLSTIGSGMTFRIGNRLNEQHAFVSMEPFIRDFGDFDFSIRNMPWNMYVGAEYRYVFYNEIITGNGNDITLENSVYDLFSGIGVSLGKWNINYQYVLRGREFEEDSRFNIFGRIVIGCSF